MITIADDDNLSYIKEQHYEIGDPENVFILQFSNPLQYKYVNKLDLDIMDRAKNEMFYNCAIP